MYGATVYVHENLSKIIQFTNSLWWSLPLFYVETKYLNALHTLLINSRVGVCDVMWCDGVTIYI